MNSDRGDLKRNPIDIDAYTWYYEDSDGIDLIHEVKDSDGTYKQTDNIKIPWKRLLESVYRKYPHLKRKK